MLKAKQSLFAKQNLTKPKMNKLEQANATLFNAKYVIKRELYIKLP